jgi:uncharacterized protein YcbK (DUF882 family)
LDDARRGFLRLSVLGPLAAALAARGRAAPVRIPAARRLSFYNTHTRETVDVVYWSAGRPVPEGLAAISRVLRDHRTNDVLTIDPALVDLLYRLRVRLRATVPFHIISGYRSPATNEALRGRAPDSGVAKFSQHTLGKAADVRVPGVALTRLRDEARALRGGGVGFYPASDFVHVDVGRVRTW